MVSTAAKANNQVGTSPAGRVGLRRSEGPDAIAVAVLLRIGEMGVRRRRVAAAAGVNEGVLGRWLRGTRQISPAKVARVLAVVGLVLKVDAPAAAHAAAALGVAVLKAKPRGVE